MTPEQEAQELILTLEGLVERLRGIANGKNYSRKGATLCLEIIRSELELERP